MSGPSSPGGQPLARVLITTEGDELIEQLVREAQDGYDVNETVSRRLSGCRP